MQCKALYEKNRTWIREKATISLDRVAGLGDGSEVVLCGWLRDLKLLGAHNVTVERPRGLMGRRRLDAVERAYEAYRLDGRIPATYEVLYGHAWVPEQKPIADGVAIPVSAIRRLERT